MLAQPRHSFSVLEYHRMAEIGVLRPDARVELLDGQIFDMSPIGPFHGWLVNRLTRIFNLESRGRWIVASQTPVQLDDRSEPQPDLMLLKPDAEEYMNRHPLPEDVLLLIEISDTTLRYDREVKIPAYGRAGVQEVWVVNLDEGCVEVYREPNFTGYMEKTVFQPGEKVKPRTFQDLVLDVTSLLKRSR